jgi:hydroxymethylpyrimidine pyrophosphatase-like HAD family hydrolase
MSPIRLLATDLDGTLIGSADEFHLYGDFEELLVQLRAKFGTAWAVCTGRRHRSFLRMMGPLRTLGLLPDYVIVRHAYIYKQTRWGYVPHVAWNVRIMLHVMLSRLHIREAINEWYGLLSKMCTGSTVISKTKTRLCLRFENEEDADAAERMLREKVTEFTHLCVFRFMREVDVRLVPFTKGLALGDLADGLGVDHAEVLAIGDGHNDLSMLDRSILGMSGCPANAQSEVIEAVHRAGGHISEKRALAGVMDVIMATLEGRVDSALPTGWRPSRETAKQHSRRWADRADRRKQRHHAHPKKWRSILIATGVLYAVATAFAQFGLLPRIIARPVDKLVEWLVSIVPF